MKTIGISKIVFVVFIFITSLTSFGYAQKNTNKFIVVLDAGHGGGDHGNVGNGHLEKDIALKVVLEVGKALEKYPDIKVIYTRKKDVFIPLHKRASIANKADADLFVSVHCNSVANSSPHGTETWVLGEKNTGRNFEVAKKENEVIFLEDNYEENYAGFDPSSPESTIAIGIEQEVYVEQSILLARKIEDSFKSKAMRKSRGLKQGSLLVIRNTYMPSVLVELGFLTNKKEGNYLNTKDGQSVMAKALKSAIVDYKKLLDENVGDGIILDNEDEEEISEKRIVEDVTFKVQIAASARDLELKSYNFKGLPQLSKQKVGKMYKYFYGSTSDYNEIQRLKSKAKSKGYSTAFVVAFKGDDQISIAKALQ